MRETIFIIFVIAVAISFVFNAYRKWYDCEWTISNVIKSAGGYTIFVCIVYFIFM